MYTSPQMLGQAMQVKDLTPAEWPWPLLLDADPSRELIDAYIHQSTVLGLIEGNAVIAVVVLLNRAPQMVEVMNIAVAPSYQGKKLGKLLLAAAVERSRQQGVKRMVLGTGNSGIAQLAFYQKMGFRLESIDRDYFVRTYPEPIYENGIWCRDRVLLSLDL
ncbi:MULTISPECIES: GNAT family N-acetyltransferase [Cyanophyceae]|uniref:GNAT family N-acetyltransferase n=2 Tax=Cyanobacteriota TaxID=1117 RepID=UPI0018F00614|nr:MULTISPECIES: GNAT family N-acetyltransferase [unclassified Phormidium]